MRERVAQGGALEFVEREAGFFLGPLDGGVGLDRRQAAGDAGEPRDRGGNLLLGAVVVRQLHERSALGPLRVEG